MVVYDTPNSSHTYDVPADAIEIDVLVRGGVGGQGGENDLGDRGGDGGAGGHATGTLPVAGGEELTVAVGEAGAFPGTGSPGGEGGQSPIWPNGGQGGDTGAFGAAGGGGGSPSGIIRESDGALIALGEGGGGGAGGDGTGGDYGGGGGGSRGGLGGDGSKGGEAADDAGGSGAGGDGGDATGPVAGQPGGTVTHADLTDVSTGTSSSGPVVEIVPRLPPARVTDLQVTDIRDTELDLAWTDRDGVSGTGPEGGYRIYTTRVGSGDRVEQADLPADTDQHTLTGLLTGEQYYIEVAAYNDAGEVGDIVTDVPSGTTETVPSGTTETEIGQHGVAGTHEIRGTHETRKP